MTKVEAWHTVRLSKIISPREETPDLNRIEAGDYSIVGKISFKTGKIEMRGKNETNTEMILIQPGDLVVSGINAVKGAVAIYDNHNTEPSVATIHYSAYKVNDEKTSAEFLWYYFRSHTFRDYLISKLPNGIKTEVKAEKLISLEISLPDKPEQERIISKIKLLEEKVRILKLEIKKAKNFCKYYVTHYSNKLFQNETNWKPLEELTERITKGESPGWQGYDYQEEGPLFVTSENVWNKQIRLNKVKHIPVEFHNKLNRSKIKKNDVLINLVGASIGRAAKYDLDIDDANVNQAVAVVTLKDGEIKPDYLVNYYLSSYAQEAILGKRKNTARDNISLDNLRNLKVPKPDDSKQDEVNVTIEKLEKKISVLQIEITKLEQALDALVPSVLDKAFKGEW